MPPALLVVGEILSGTLSGATLDQITYFQLFLGSLRTTLASRGLTAQNGKLQAGSSCSSTCSLQAVDASSHAQPFSRQAIDKDPSYTNE